MWFCWLGGVEVFAQWLPETSFYWENPYSINPASIRPDDAAFFTLSGRKQWEGIDGAPTTLWATGVYYWEDYRMQGGVKIMGDKIGYVSTFDVSVSYAYSLRLSRESYLNMGLSAIYQSQSVDRGEVAFEEENEEIQEHWFFENRQQWNTSLGMEYGYDGLVVVGVSCQNLFSFLKEEEAVFGGINYVYGRYRTRYLGRSFEQGRYRTRSIERSFDVEAGVCLRQYKHDFQVDGMISLYVNRNTQREKFQFSLLGRSVGEVGVLAGVKLPSELKFLFSYDYNFGSLQRFSRGSFEVMVSYPIKHRRDKKCVPIF